MEALEPDQGQWPGKGCWLVRAFLMLYQCWIGDLSEWVNWSSPSRWVGGEWGVRSAGTESMQCLELRLMTEVLVSKQGNGCEIPSKDWDSIQVAVPYRPRRIVDEAHTASLSY